MKTKIYLVAKTILNRCIVFTILFTSLLKNQSNAQQGTVSSPFTQLGQAQNISTEGVYYFNLTGTSFSTYVKLGGWVQVAIDFSGSTGGAMPQQTALTNSVRGILEPAVLTKLGSATKARIYVSSGQLDVQNTNSTILTRIVNNQALHKGGNDNGINTWTGTNTLSASFSAGGCNAAANNGLHQRVIHTACNGDGVHWIPVDNMRQIRNNLGEIASGNYFQLLIQAPFVAVVNGPTINTQPSNTAQNLCINSSSTALSVSATSPTSISYQWYSNTTASTAGGTLISGAISNTYTPPTNVVGTRYYYVILTNTIGSTTSNISGAITVSPISVSGTASANQTICSGTSPSAITLTGFTGAIQWQVSTDNSTFSNISGATGTTLTSAQMGTLTSLRYYRAVVTSGTCTSAISNVITVNVTVPPAIVVTSGSNCGSGSVSLSASAASGTLNWYAAPSGGSSLGTGPNFTTPSISSTVTYYVDVTFNGCTSSPRVAVTAIINSIPADAINGTGSINAEVLVVGGGGSGGYRHGGGGGGGGVVYQSNFIINVGNIPVTVGNGGIGNSVTGQNSVFSTITAFGGGGGGNDGLVGKNGGSGGGGANGAFGGNGTAGQGNKGGNQNNGNGCCFPNGAGGGGAGAAGANTTGGNSSAGGVGISLNISGTSVFYGGGGGGGTATTTSMTGGNGGGGAGGRSNALTGTSGTSNTGGGGGGGGANGGSSGNGGNGGSGVVIIKYLGTPVATGGIITQTGGFTIHTFNSSGTFVLAGSSTANIPNVSLCGTGSATFNGTVSAGLTLDWYNAATGGNLLSSGATSFTTPVISGTTTYYVSVRNVSTGCVSATRTAVTATVQGSASISNNQNVCIGDVPSNITLSNPTGTIQWQSSNDNVNFTNVSGQTGATLNGSTIGTVNATKYYKAIITNGACIGSTPTHTITANPLNVNGTLTSNDLIWRGKINNDWSIVDNWTRFNGTTYISATGTPTSNDVVRIPKNQTCVMNQPTINSLITSAQHIIIDSAAILTLSSGTFSLNGSLINHGSIVPGTATIRMTGSNATDSIVCDGLTNTFYNLTIDKTSGNEVQMNSDLNVINQISLINKDLHLNNYVLNLGTTGILVNEGSGHRIYCNCASGYVERTASIGANVTINPGNLGLTFNTTGNQLGTTVIRRRHSRAGSFGIGSLSGSTSGVYRIYDVNPEFNGSDYTSGSNPGLNLNLEFTYLDEEIGNEISSQENEFGIFRSTNSGSIWNAHFGSVNSSNNIVQLSNFDAFSWITVGPNVNTALPIELVSFQASCEENGTANISWITASEHNTSHFEIEKSRDGENWSSLGNIAAAGNSNDMLTYNFNDADPNDQVTYYQLKQFDNDGIVETFGPISIDCSIDLAKSFYSFPNPGTSSFDVYFQATENGSGASFILFDAEGRIINNKTLDFEKGINVFSVDNASLKTGVYFIRLMLTSGSTYWTKHIVK